MASAKPRRTLKWPDPAAVREAHRRELESLRQAAAAAAGSPTLSKRQSISQSSDPQFSITIARLSNGTQADSPPSPSWSNTSGGTPPPDSPVLGPIAAVGVGRPLPEYDRTANLRERATRKMSLPVQPTFNELRDADAQDALAMSMPRTDAEPDSAMVLFLGSHMPLANHLISLRHQVTCIDELSTFAASFCAHFDVVLVDSLAWPLVEPTPTMRRLRKLSPHAAVITYDLPASQIRCLDPRQRCSVLQELVKLQATLFLTTARCAAAERTVDELKVVEMQLSTASSALAQAEESFARSGEALAKLTAEKLGIEQSLSFMTSENTRLRTQLVKARAAAQAAKPAPTPKVVNVGAYQDLDTLRATLESCATPKDVAASTFTWLLTDPAYRAVHDLIQNALQALNGEAPDTAELEQILRASGMDAATQYYILYSFSGNASRVSRVRRTATPAAPSNEKPLALVAVPDLSAVDSWQFNALDYNNERLITLCVHMFERLNLLEIAGVPRNNLIRFLRAACKLYKDIPYHSFAHAVDVAQVCYRMVLNTTARQYLTDLDVFALMVAAISHDMDHPGTSNAFQVADSTTLAILYNDQSPLENHHASCAFVVAADPACDIFAGLVDATYVAVRKAIIKAILITDMQNHFELQKQLTGVQRSFLEAKSVESRQFMVNLLIHMADLCNPCRPWEISKAWSDRVLTEFFQQGDVEREKSMPISAQCDRYTTKQESMSMGFIDFIVAPMFAAAATNVVPELQVLVDTLRANRGVWEALGMAKTAQAQAASSPASPAPIAHLAASSPASPSITLSKSASSTPGSAASPTTPASPAAGPVADSPVVPSVSGSVDPAPARRSYSLDSTPADPSEDSADAKLVEQLHDHQRPMTRVRSRSLPSSPAARPRSAVPGAEPVTLPTPTPVIAVVSEPPLLPSPMAARRPRRSLTSSLDSSHPSDDPRSTSDSNLLRHVVGFKDPLLPDAAPPSRQQLRSSLPELPTSLLEHNLLGGVADMAFRAGARVPAIFKSVADPPPRSDMPRSEFFVRRSATQPRLPTIAKAS